MIRPLKHESTDVTASDSRSLDLEWDVQSIASEKKGV
jgi:hypothetical protein